MSDEQQEIRWPQREKVWSELTDSEKLERMHGVVKSLMRQLQELEGKVIDIDQHDHLNGRVVFPASRGRNYVKGVGNTASGSEWF